MSNALFEKIHSISFMHAIKECAEELQTSVYVVGGYLRDLIMGRLAERPPDIDFAVEGNAIRFASLFARKMGDNCSGFVPFKKFGTAKVFIKSGDTSWEVNFSATRSEWYEHTSRKPHVQFTHIEEDLKRRDFTVNAIAAGIWGKHAGIILDPFNGQKDIALRLLRTPDDPIKTFHEDPLRIMRAFRFASQLDFSIEDNTYKAILATVDRLKIVSIERVVDEINKLLLSDKPSRGLSLMEETGVMQMFLPEVSALKGVEEREGKAHKDNFKHILKVMDNIARLDSQKNLWLRWAALLHDIGKPATRKFDPHEGWTFHGHDVVGARMVPAIFRRLRLPMDERMRYVKNMVYLHQRPVLLAMNETKAHGFRKLAHEAGPHLEDLFTLALADITSRRMDLVRKYVENLQRVKQQIFETLKKDEIMRWQPPFRGDHIMEILGLPPGPTIGIIKNALKEAILQEIIPDDKEIALQFIYEKAKAMGLTPAMPYEVARKKFIEEGKANERKEKEIKST